MYHIIPYQQQEIKIQPEDGQIVEKILANRMVKRKVRVEKKEDRSKSVVGGSGEDIGVTSGSGISISGGNSCGGSGVVTVEAGDGVDKKENERGDENVSGNNEVLIDEQLTLIDEANKEDIEVAKTAAEKENDGEKGDNEEIDDKEDKKEEKEKEVNEKEVDKKEDNCDDITTNDREEIKEMSVTGDDDENIVSEGAGNDVDGDNADGDKVDDHNDEDDVNEATKSEVKDEDNMDVGDDGCKNDQIIDTNDKLLDEGRHKKDEIVNDDRQINEDNTKVSEDDNNINEENKPINTSMEEVKDDDEEDDDEDDPSMYKEMEVEEFYVKYKNL